MLEILQKKIKSGQNREAQINLLREFLQVLILKILSDQKAFTQIVFIGGTALRILYDLKRYSEDLDFSLYNSQEYDFQKMIAKLKSGLEQMNLKVEFRHKEGVVDSLMIAFTEILQSLDLHFAKDQKLSIKLEIDTKPPEGGTLQTTLVNDEFIFPVKHYDLSSLMASKLNAVFCRGFDKGRDYYDLIWYLTQKIEPDFVLLNHSMEQTEGKKFVLSSDNWKKFLLEKIEKVDFSVIKKDVQRFLMRPEEVELLSLENFTALLKAS